VNEEMSDYTENPDWLFQEIQGESMQYLFAHVSRETYRDSPFLDHRMRPVPSEIKGAAIGVVNRSLMSDGRPADSAYCYPQFYPKNKGPHHE